MQFFRRRTIYDYYQAEHIIRHTKNAVFIDLLYLQYWLNCLDTNNTYHTFAMTLKKGHVNSIIGMRRGIQS